MNIKNNKKYRRTKKGLITSLYGHQRSRCKEKGIPYPDYSKEEFSNWLLSRSNFETLWEEWVNSNYDKNKTLSINRIDNSISYTLDNIELISWEDHIKQTGLSMRKGELVSGTKHKAVIGINKENGSTLEFVSIKEASRKLSISNAHISLCCNNKQGRKSAGGYIWKFK